MTRRTVVIDPDGSERPLQGIPPIAVMRGIVGGPIELVRVLREDLPGFTYTWMIVNENGLIEGLLRNQRATDIDLANVRRAHPDADDPSKAARDQFLAGIPEAMEVIDGSPAGWADDPYVAGTVIWFDGWTCDELERAGL